MNKFIPCLAIFAALLACSEKGDAQSNKIILDCGIEITSIDDRPGEMDAELFSGKLTAEQKLSYMHAGKAPSSVNIFLVKTAGKTYMIDAGYGNAIKDGRIDLESVNAVFLSHKHGDHISGLLQEDSATFSATIHVSEPERDYWLSEDAPNSDLQKKLAEIYANDYRTFKFGDTLAPGIVAINASGHTPGHTAFIIGEGEQKLLIAADFLHAAVLQLPEPTESANFDIDKKEAVEIRIALMKLAAEHGWFIAGSHIPNPGWGKIKSNGKGGFQLLTND